MCRQMKQLLDEYRGGEVEGQRRAQCEAHLQSCARCSDSLREREALSAVLRGWEKAEASDALAARVVAAWQTGWPEARAVARRGSMIARVAVGVGAVAVAGLISFAGVRTARAVGRIRARPSAEARGGESLLEPMPELEVSHVLDHGGEG